MTRINRNFAKGIKDDGTPDYAKIEGHTLIHPTHENYAKIVVPAGMSS